MKTMTDTKIGITIVIVATTVGGLMELTVKEKKMENEKLIESANKWAKSDEGQKELAEAAKEAQECSARLKVMRQVDTKTLYEPFTI